MGLNRNLGQLTEVIKENDGKIGIGNSNPIRKLEVASDGANWISGTFSGTGNTDKVVIGNLATPTIGGHNSALNAWSDFTIAGANINFSPYGSTAMRLFDNGNVFIGSSPVDSGYKLDVNGLVRMQSGLTLSNYDGLSLKLKAATSTGSTYLRFFNSGDTARGYLGLFWNGTSDYMVCDAGTLEMNFASSNKFTFNGSNVGINESNPISKLHVTGTMRTALVSGAGGDTLISAIIGVSNGYLINVDTGNNITHTWHTGTNNPSMRITSGGNVGIGTTSPSEKLQVNGNILAVGNIYTTDSSILNLGYNQGGGATLKYNSNGNLDITPRAGYNSVFTAGNVGIGTATFVYSPKIAVNSVGQNTLAIQTTDSIQGSTGTVLYVGTGATTGNTYGIIRALGDGGTGNANLVLQPSGNVLIGTTSDNGKKLQVNGDLSANTFFANADPGNPSVDSSGRFINLANGAYIDFPSMSGMIIVNNTGTGAIQAFLCGGGNTASLGFATGTTGSMAHSPSVGGYRFTNNTGATWVFSFQVLKTRGTA